MSVFTQVSETQLVTFLQNYPLGALHSFKGIEDGIENTNYFINTDRGAFVLTLFEQHDEQTLPFFLDLMAHQANSGVPTAHPVATKDGAFLTRLNNRPAAIVERLPGGSVDRPEPKHCQQIGQALAGFHQAGTSFSQTRAPDRGLDWAEQTAAKIRPKLTESDRALLDDELHFQRAQKHGTLPSGTIHADLFRDNALFDGDQLTGIIDLYYACTDALIYDLAIAINDWCIDAQATLDVARLKAMIAGYTQIRAITPAERDNFPAMLRQAALRFWISRLEDSIFPRSAEEMTFIKDPTPFKQILTSHRNAGMQPRQWLDY